MAKVEIIVNGRSFQVGCEDGQEAHLRALAERFDAQVGKLAEQVGQIGDLRLFLMAGLVICDELADAESQAGRGGAQNGGEAAALLTRAAERIEALAARAETAS